MGMKWIEGEGYVPVQGYLYQILQRLPYFSDTSLQSIEDAHESQLSPVLMIPPTNSGSAIAYQILEHPHLLDSSNMTMADWQLIASEVETWYDKFDAFVVIHGTDTMAYTASALSFMLESLAKPVVLTGSQVPFSELRNDATDNLLGAMMMAAHGGYNEVTVYFAHRLYRGNRCTKISNDALCAFDSPNYPHLAEAGVYIHRHHHHHNREYTLHAPPRTHLLVHRHLDPNVAVLRIFPGMSVEAFRAFLAPPIRGVVLCTFGSGNMPNNRPDLLAALKEAIEERGVIVVNVSQCPKGHVRGTASYATGRVLDALGVIPGSDMTVECALAKLSFILSFPWSTDEVKQQMRRALRGELSEPEKDRLCSELIASVLHDDPSKLQGLLGSDGASEVVSRLQVAPLLGAFNLLHFSRYLNRYECANILESSCPFLAVTKDASNRLPSDLS